MSFKYPARWYLVTILAANLSLLLPDGYALRVFGALLLIGFLPGLGWADLLLSVDRPTNFQPPNSSGEQPGSAYLIELFLFATAFSYTFTSLIVLLLQYLPGPVHNWQILLALNSLSLAPMLRPSQGAKERRSKGTPQQIPSRPLHFRSLAANLLPLGIILLIALWLRAGNLSFSEFQGDEALAMITAAEALEGHDDALFLRAKGPGEVLLPMALWRLTGTITEATARLPFALAAVWAVVTIFLIGCTLGGSRLGWLAAGFFAVNGFMVAFGRIVQYQTLVVWFSALAFWLAVQWRSSHQPKLIFTSGLFLGSGLLAHYDAILVLPAIGWLLVASRHFGAPALMRLLQSASLFVLGLAMAALPFYLPYSLDPQANRTGEYVGERIGHELRNNLPDFFHFNSFYSSFYYIAITSLLVLGLLIWLFWSTPRRRPLTLLGLAAGVVAIWPGLLRFEGLDASLLPFALLLLAAFFALSLGSAQQALIVWLGVPFLGYNFVVALGLTHIYTIVPAWSLLAAWGWLALIEAPRVTKQAAAAAIDSEGLKTTRPGDWLRPLISPAPHLHEYHRRWSTGFLIFGLTLSTIFLWNAFLRTEVSYWQDYPAGQLALFWTPFDQPPETGFFGFVHRTGWKALGQTMAGGHLAGDYGSNEEPDVTSWYTRGAPRACDSWPEYYFLATDLVDPVDTPDDLIAAAYKQVGRVALPNQKQLRIMQQMPANLQLGGLDEAALARAFDASAQPVAFARSARGSVPTDAVFGSTAYGPLVRLVGYDLDTRRAYPAGRLPLTLYWQPLASFPASYQIFAHVESESGPLAQADGVPVCWTYPTDTWRPGQIIADQHSIRLWPEVMPGRYPLAIGLYLPDTFERLDVLDVTGHPAGTSLTLAEIEIKNGAVGE